jgi:glycosyltransferase involved in cell wall biosynthesis
MRSLIAAFGRLLGGSSRPLNVAVVASQIVPFDGTSNAVRDTIRAVSGVADWRVSVFAKAASVEGIRVHQVEGAADLARRAAFRSADIIVYHFGFYDELFEVLRDGNRTARQLVLFHNITPAEFMAEQFRPLVARSFEQVQYFHGVDRLLPFTSTNAEVLIGAGFDASRVVVVDPVIEWPSPWFAARKAARAIEVLFVGRMTRSKGVMDLLHAVESLRTECAVPFHVTLVGGQVEQEYIDAVRERSSAMAPLVEFVGQCGKDELEDRYRAAHILAIPSYHEGFCRPVAEGLRSGCIPVGYASYHVPIVANRLGRLTEPGNIQALARALKSTIEDVHRALANPTAASLLLDRGPTSLAEFDALASEHVRQFSFERFSNTLIGQIRSLRPQHRDFRQ